MNFLMLLLIFFTSFSFSSLIFLPNFSFASVSEYQLQLRWGTNGTENGEFMVPHSMAFDSAGNIYVSDVNNHRIQKFTSDGEFITKWGTEGNGDGQFGLPLGIGSDSKGNIFIIDQATSSIPQFSNQGQFINKIIFNFGKLEDIEIDSNDSIYVTDRNKNEILKFSKIIN